MQIYLPITNDILELTIGGSCRDNESILIKAI